MWNFGVPYALKYYIDAIVQPGYLFYNERGQPEPLVHGKKMICVTTRAATTPRDDASFDFVENYLRTIFGFVGITDIRSSTSSRWTSPPTSAERRSGRRSATCGPGWRVAPGTASRAPRWTRFRPASSRRSSSIVVVPAHAVARPLLEPRDSRREAPSHAIRVLPRELISPRPRGLRLTVVGRAPERMAAPIRPGQPQYRDAPCRICGSSVEVRQEEREGAGSV